jgi:hypothetical protein
MQRGAVGVRAGSEGCCRVLAGTGQHTMWAASYTSRASCRCQAAAYAATPCNAVPCCNTLQRALHTSQAAAHCVALPPMSQRCAAPRRCRETHREGRACLCTRLTVGLWRLTRARVCWRVCCDVSRLRAAAPSLARRMVAWWERCALACLCGARCDGGRSAGGLRSDRCAPASDAGKPRTTARLTGSLPSRPARTPPRRVVSSTRAMQMAQAGMAQAGKGTGLSGNNACRGSFG